MWAIYGKWSLALPCPHIILGDSGGKSWLIFINEPISHVCHFTAAFWISFARIQLMGFYKDVVGQIVGTFLLSVPWVEHCHTNGTEDLQGGGCHSLTPLDTDIQLYGIDTSVKLLFFSGVLWMSLSSPLCLLISLHQPKLITLLLYLATSFYFCFLAHSQLKL